MSTQPEALRLAADLPMVKYTADWLLCDQAATELRRLHAANMDCIEHFNAIKAERDELFDAIILLVAGIENSVSPKFIPMIKARAAIAKASA